MRPPALARNPTQTMARSAPRNAPIVTPSEARIAWELPITMTSAAPVDAPDEMPRMYGSPSGFLNSDWVMRPHIASPAPVANPSNTRGKRISVITCCSTPPSAPINAPRITCSIEDREMSVAPSATPNNRQMLSKIASAIRSKTRPRRSFITVPRLLGTHHHMRE